MTKKNKKMRSNYHFQRLIATFMLALILAAVPVTAKAATYTKDNLSLSINNGMAVLTVNGSETYQLTKSLVVNDGGIDENGTVWLVWKSGSLYWYNYQYQKSDTKLHLLDNGVISLTRDSKNLITGYDTAAGHKSPLSLQQIKAELGINNNNGNNNTDNNNSNNTDTNNPISIIGNTIVIYTADDGSKYMLSTDKIVDKAASDTNGTVWVRFIDGSIKCWNYILHRFDPVIQMKEVTKTSSTLVMNSDGKATGYYSLTGELKPLLTLYQISMLGNQEKKVTLNNGVVTLNVTENGTTKSYVLAKDLSIDTSAIDANDTAWIRYNDKNLYIWNYKLQKDEKEIRLLKVTDKCTALVVVDGKAYGYYEEDNSKMKPLWTENQIKSAIATADTNSSATDESNKNCVIQRGEYLDLYDKNGNKIATTKLAKDGKWCFDGDTDENIEWTSYTRGNRVIKMNNKGKVVLINRITKNKKTLVKSGASYFQYDSKGYAIYIVKKYGPRMDIRKK